MDNELLVSVFNQFNTGGELLEIKELASGHINDTYLIRSSASYDYVLQRTNHGVFKNVPGLIFNKVNISEHISKKLSHLSEKERMRSVLTFVKTKNGQSFFKDGDGNFWNMMVFIDESQTFERVTDRKIAYEGGKLSGEFLNLTSDFDPNLLVEVIPKFHDMTFRYGQFLDSLKTADKDRYNKSKAYIDKVIDLKEEMHIIQNLKDAGKIKLRVTHNDTKISNTLFDLENKGLCVIDTDTVMPGIIHYDFSDAIRTICNTAAEDEKDLDQVSFNLEYYQAYLKGFLETTGASMTELEKKYLPLSAKTMIFEQAIRFLADYLNGDVYYKTSYPEHNLVRAKNQFKLMDSFDQQMDLTDLKA